MHGRKKGVQAAVCAFIVLALQSGVSATVMPDAGSVSVNIDQTREWRPRDRDLDIQVDLGRVSERMSKVRIRVKKFRVTGQNVLPEAELENLTRKYWGQEMRFRDLRQVVHSITEYFHMHGYMTALAYLPEQEIVDGVVTISVIVGEYGDVRYDNRSELLTGRAEGLSHMIRKGAYITRHPLDRALLILNDIPGVKAHAYLSPGSEPGTANGRILLETTEKSGGLAYTDNYGSRFTGRWRIGASYHWNNLSHVGDQLMVGYLQSFGAGIYNYNLRYELPVGIAGAFAGAEVARTDYTLGENYAPFDAVGTAQTWRLYASAPGKRTLDNNLFWELSFEHSLLDDRINLVDYDARKHMEAIRFGIRGDDRSNKRASTYELIHTIGWMHADNENAQAQMDSGRTGGSFQKTRLDLYHIQTLGPSLRLHMSLRGQYAWSNLDSSERLYIGGYNAVRAFPQGETGGDIGVLGSAELRWQTPNPHWRMAVFYDTGWVRFQHDAMSGGDRTRSLKGAGLGLMWSDSGHSYARLDYALPVGKRHSETYGKDIGGTWWFQFVQKI